MSKIDAAVERIKILECPTGDVEKRVAGILEDYRVANGSEISVGRDESYDRDGAEAYRARFSGDVGKSIVVLAKSGYDDYVAKVVDAYIS
jgi:hypothetical protein